MTSSITSTIHDHAKNSDETPLSKSKARNLLPEPAGSKQHFPTYHVSDGSRDILLAEYETTAKTLEADEKLFSNTTNVTQIIFSIFASLAIGGAGGATSSLLHIDQWQVLLVFLVLSCGYAAFSILTFANRHKAIVFAQRKIVVLRKMLGLDYGRLQLILPNKRVEGTNNPFSISMFNGYFSTGSYPLCITALFSSVLTFLLTHGFFIKQPQILHSLNAINFSPNALNASILFCIIWLSFLLCLIRASLFDTNETFLLVRTKLYAKLLAVRLVQNFEYIIYRSKLAWCETERLEIQTDILSTMLVFLEDRDFFKHKGISYKSILRAFLGILGRKRPSGGSTITQQLVRTLFIIDFNKKFRRKFLELLLALWFECVCTKQEILKMYLSSVQYERGVLGLPEAMKFFFDRILQSPTKAQAFFLIERVSNVRSLILFDKICASVRQAHEIKLLSAQDIHELVSIYIEMLNKGLLRQGNEKIYDQLEMLRNRYKLHEAT